MEPQIIQGIWDEVAALHAANLKGRHVEIRVLDGGNDGGGVYAEGFEASMLRIAELTRGAAQITREPLRAEGFYESAD